jgi:hypothetical protein
MSVWAREVVGWLMLGVGLAGFAVTYNVFLLNRLIIEAGGLGFMAFIVFRSGLHLLKVAVAARAAREADPAVAAAVARPAADPAARR